MLKVKLDKKCSVIALSVALIYIVITFFTDRSVFDFQGPGMQNAPQAIFDYCICKIIALVALLCLNYSILSVFMTDSEYGRNFKSIVFCALPYLVVMAVVLVIKLPEGFLTNDEASIYANATGLVHDTWFNYLTIYYYIASLMILPFKYGPIIVKVIIEFFVIGYTVFRTKRYFGKKAGLFSYLIFLLYPVIAYTTSAHRLPIYFLLYLVLFAKLLFDNLEDAGIDIVSLILILTVGAVLTQWRTEGIYLIVILPILLLFTYKSLRNRKSVIALVLAYAFIQLIIWISQNGLGANLSGAANDRMKPFYAYTITNMARNGLDFDKNAEDLAIVDKYLSLDKIREINEYYEDINYEDVLILYKEGFIGVREDADVTEFVNYSEAVKRIFIANPGVFLKTRVGAFCYAALPYHIVKPEGGIRGLVLTAVSLVKTVSYNLFIPVIIVFALLLVSLFKKKWYSFFFFGGVICHWFIVFILAPASYFKYYFPVYIMAYFYVCILAIWLLAGKKKDCKSPLV